MLYLPAVAAPGLFFFFWGGGIEGVKCIAEGAVQNFAENGWLFAIFFF